MGTAIQEMGNVDRILHSPARLMVVTILYTAESADFLYLQRETGLTKGNLSSNLSKLEESNYLEIEKTYRGKIPLTVCRLTGKGRVAFQEYRNRLQQFLTTTG